MSLREVVRARALEPTTDLEALASTHAWLSVIAGVKHEAILAQALQDQQHPKSVAVIGRTGQGKSSLMMSVTANLAKLNEPENEILIVRAGDAEGVLASPGAFAQHLLQTIQTQGFRFADRVQERLREVGADETTTTDEVRSQSGGISGGSPVITASYETTLQDAYEQRSYAQNEAKAHSELGEVIRIIREAGAWPIVVIDDTDRFVDPHEEIADAASVEGLFGSAVRLLAEAGIPHVVAVHPRFQADGSYTRARSRHNILELELPFLNVEEGRNPPELILAKHLTAHGIDTPVGDMFEGEAQAALWGAYTPNRDLRLFLRAADRAAHLADQARADRVDLTVVGRALDELTS